MTTYGSARWASVREIEEAYLFGDARVFLGRLTGRYLWRDDYDERWHCLA